MRQSKVRNSKDSALPVMLTRTQGQGQELMPQCQGQDQGLKISRPRPRTWFPRPRLRFQGQGLNHMRPTCNVNIWRSKMTMITNFMYFTAKQTRPTRPTWHDEELWRMYQVSDISLYWIHVTSTEFWICEQFKWHFPMNTWQKPMTRLEKFVRYSSTLWADY